MDQHHLAPQMEEVRQRIEHVLTNDNVFDPESNPKVKSIQILQELFQGEGREVSFSSRRYGIRSVNKEGQSVITIYERANNLNPEEIVDQIIVGHKPK